MSENASLSKEDYIFDIGSCMESSKPRSRHMRKITPKKQNEQLSKTKYEENSKKRKLSSLLEESDENSDSTETSSNDDDYDVSGRVKRKKNSLQSMTDVPKDLQEIITMLGIDEILKEKAMTTKLTAAHVMNIIQQVKTNTDDATPMNNSQAGSEELQTSNMLGPKYTRAKTKFLIEQHIKETGDDILCHMLLNNSGASRACVEAHTLASEDFPDEDSGDDYDPSGDREGDKSEDEVHFGTPNGTPRTPAQSIDATTPSSGGFSSQKRTTPKILPMNPLNAKWGKIAQRTLDFTKPANMTPELISSRTRSRYPMTDTPVEYLEMQLKQPHISPDLYTTFHEYDKNYSEFLLEYALPAENLDTLEDDDAADPDFNVLMGDCRITKQDLLEEVRDDKAVHVSKRECSEIITEFLDSYQHNLYDLNDYASSATSELMPKICPTSRAELLASSNTHFSCETPRCDSVDSSLHHKNCDTPQLNSQLSSIIEEDFDFIIEKTPQPDATDVPSIAPIIVNFLIPRFTAQQLKVINVQMMQHIQLLTTTTLLCHNCDYWKDMATSCRKMLNDICTHANTSSNISDNIFSTWNLRASIDTLRVYDTNQHLDNQYPAEDFKRRLSFTKLMKFVFLNSSAFPFVHLLPRNKYCNPRYNVNSANNKMKLKKFMPSEDWLLTQALRELFASENRNKIVSKGRALRGSELRKTAIAISKKGILLKKANVIAGRITLVRRKYKFLGKCADNPIVKFLEYGIYEVSPLLQKIPRFTPCALKNVPEFVNLPPAWILLKGEYWAENHKTRPDLAVSNVDQEVVDNRPICMIVYPNTNTAVDTAIKPCPSQSQAIQLVSLPPNKSSSKFETGFVANPSPLLPLCSTSPPLCPVGLVSMQEPIFVDCSAIVVEECNTADENNELFIPNENILVETIPKNDAAEAVDINMPSLYPPSEYSPNQNMLPTVNMPELSCQGVMSSCNNSAVALSDTSGSNLSLGGIVEDLNVNDMPFLMATPAKTVLSLPVESIETPIVECNDTTLETPWKNCNGTSAALVSALPMNDPITKSITFSQSKKVTASVMEDTTEKIPPKPITEADPSGSPRKITRRTSRRRKPPHFESSNLSSDEENIDDPDSVPETSDTVIVKHELEFDECSTIDLSPCHTSERGDYLTPSIRSQSRMSDCSNNTEPPQTSEFWELCKRSLLPNYINVFKKLKCVLSQFDSCRIAPEKLFLKVEQVLFEFPPLVNKFLLFLKPSQAMNISKYTEYCAATRLNYFLQKLKSHSDKAQQIETLTAHIQLMQKKSMSIKKIEELKSKVSPVLQCPNLLDMFGRCFLPPPPFGKFDELLKEYTTTINNRNEEASSLNCSVCCCQTDSTNKAMLSKKLNKGKENDVQKVITGKNNYIKNRQNSSKHS